jgi:hypothetical protein
LYLHYVIETHSCSSTLSPAAPKDGILENDIIKEMLTNKSTASVV